MSGNDQGFLKRWSNRKAAVLEAEQALEAVHDEPQVEDERSDEEVLADLDLPDPDDLKPGDDFSAFMQSAVPTRLRNRALRKLWLSNPTLAAVDGLVDYGEDFTDAATVVENLQTAYQVGKGIVSKIEETVEKIDEKVAELVPDQAEKPGQEDEDAENSNVSDSLPKMAASAADQLPGQIPEQVSVERKSDVEPIAPAVSRMRFAFEPATKDTI